MKKFTIYLTLILILSIQKTGNTQTNYWEENHHMPIPPNAAALFKTMEKPIGTFTGVPPISIPIYTCSNRGYTLPITLNYNAGGIKVEELASSVGLGWNLSAGGMISRIQKGRPDEIYLAQTHKPTESWCYTGSGLYQYQQGNLDLEPDIFVFSVNGLSGEFALDEAGNAFVFDKQLNIKVSRTNGIAWFIITDAQGYSYHFNNPHPWYNSAGNNVWFLDKVKDMNGKEVVSFEYWGAGYTYYTRRMASISSDAFGGYFGNCTSADWSTYEGTLENAAHEYTIRKIKMGGDTVIFNLGSRTDIGSYKINSIEVKDKNGTLRKKFNFNYEYFNSGRLKLKNFSEQPTSGTDSLTYSFTYEENVNLHERTSCNTDYWGYFNGANNTSSIPNGIYHYNGYTVGVGDRGDRRANPAYAKANTLTKITFPSGGYREFEYEGNTILYNAYDYNGYLYPDADDHVSHYFDTTEFDENGAVQYQRNFTISSTDGYSLFYFQIEGAHSGYGNNFSVKIYHGGSPVTVKQFIDEYSGSCTLANGNYTVKLVFDSWCYFYNFYCYWDDLNLTGNTISRLEGTFKKANQNAGGLRIKTINDYDPVTNKNHYTRYKYFLPSDTTLTSGMLISYPKMLYRTKCEYSDCDRIRIASHSGYPLNADEGSYVCYTNVRVVDDGNGYTDRLYNFVPDDDISSQDFPVVPNKDNGLNRGQLLSATYYNQSGKLLRKDTIDYISFSPEFHHPTVRSLSVRLSIWDYDYYYYCSNSHYNVVECSQMPITERSIIYSPGGNQENKTFSQYYTGLGSFKLKKQSTVQSNGDSIITYYRYPFNTNTDFKLPLSIAEKAMKDTLFGLNLLSPIEVVTYRKKGNDSVFVEGVKTAYGTFYSAMRLPVTVKQYTSLSDSSVVNFSAYDTCGNVREQYKTNDIKEVYLWGYNNKYVVAKVTGSNYSTVAAMVNNSVLQAPSSEAALRTELNNIRTGLAGSKAQVNTYTYLPVVGLSSSTDVNGNTAFYEYDLHGRLIRIRDQNNNIIRKFSYKVTQ